MIFELFGEIKTILQRIAVIVPGHPGRCMCGPGLFHEYSV